VPRYGRLVGFLWRWHRRIGVLAALLVVVLASTGIALNHTDELALEKRYVGWDWLRSYYGDHSAELPAFETAGRWVYRAASGRVYIDTSAVANCRGELAGALAVAGMITIACGEELLLATESGDLVESITGSSGLPAPVTGIGLVDGRLALQAGDCWRLADLERVDFSVPVGGGELVLQIAAGRLPGKLLAELPEQAQWLSWERVLLDLHSGRLFGPAGVLVMDLAALLFCVLALSGVAMWWLRRTRRRTG